MNTKIPKVSLKTIAAEAKVSRMTVSKALNNRKGVSESTRIKVQEIAQKLKYRPNLLARGVLTGSNQMVGVILPVTQSYQKMIAGISNSLEARGQSMLFAAQQSSCPQKTLEQIQRMMSLRVRGLITLPQDPSADRHYFTEVIERGIPMITISRALIKKNTSLAQNSSFSPTFPHKIDQIHLYSSSKESSCLRSQEDDFCGTKIGTLMVYLIEENEPSLIPIPSVA